MEEESNNMSKQGDNPSRFTMNDDWGPRYSANHAWTSEWYNSNNLPSESRNNFMKTTNAHQITAKKKPTTQLEHYKNFMVPMRDRDTSNKSIASDEEAADNTDTT